MSQSRARWPSRAGEPDPRMQINRQHLQLLRAVSTRRRARSLQPSSRDCRIEDVLPGPEGGVRFSGSRSAMYRANLRAALRLACVAAARRCVVSRPEDVYAAAFARCRGRNSSRSMARSRCRRMARCRSAA